MRRPKSLKMKKQHPKFSLVGMRSRRSVLLSSDLAQPHTQSFRLPLENEKKNNNIFA
ncbi:hypothetical protein HAT2_00767 [Candidatus Similichlamydia laticola]|uniref:Uncharacterized protein n=1 Tax=Candidatus Similichlamydia laticola TaxID=2170265 RepID=A0A369K961_9BACT|nr:hypothetical protein HAT2_00767 [Candidatus Similichlamydia laticola]